MSVALVWIALVLICAFTRANPPTGIAITFVVYSGSSNWLLDIVRLSFCTIDPPAMRSCQVVVSFAVPLNCSIAIVPFTVKTANVGGQMPAKGAAKSKQRRFIQYSSGDEWRIVTRPPDKRHRFR